ncbi:hypothetical protein ACQFN5_19575 [Klebsiella sp. WOUb02]|uniref:hypothetical protein n=1 Tax=Klebsiella sp. WOUb02 TaxID=3161071 RepID=UPI003CF30BB2
MHIKYLFLAYCLFISNISYSEEEFKGKWHYINPDISDIEKTKACNEGFSKQNFSELIQECKKNLKKKNISEPELPSGSNFSTYYREKRNPVTNEIEYIEQGVNW